MKINFPHISKSQIGQYIKILLNPTKQTQIAQKNFKELKTKNFWLKIKAIIRIHKGSISKLLTKAFT